MIGCDNWEIRNSKEAKNGETMVDTYSKERIDQIAEIGIQALRAAKILHDELGEDGLTQVPSPNQFSEPALKADVESENAVLESLRKSGLPIRVVSEEHGTTNLSDKPQLLGILDGIDGTSRYKEGRNRLRYATMLGIAIGTNPRYKDYLFSGIMEHSTNRLWIGIRGQGSFLVDPNGNRTQIHTSSKTIFDDSTKIYTLTPEYNDTARRYLTNLTTNFQTQEVLSLAISYADLASGQADLEIGVTRKRNLEQMIAYGLLAEVGGVMVDINGKSIGNQRYLSWGQKRPLLYVTAAGPELAYDFLNNYLPSV